MFAFHAGAGTGPDTGEALSGKKMDYKKITACFATNLPSSYRFVLTRLAIAADKRGRAWPSQETIAQDCGFNARHVRRILRALQRVGHIREDATYVPDGYSSPPISKCFLIIPTPALSQPDLFTAPDSESSPPDSGVRPSLDSGVRPPRTRESSNPGLGSPPIIKEDKKKINGAENSSVLITREEVLAKLSSAALEQARKQAYPADIDKLIGVYAGLVAKMGWPKHIDEAFPTWCRLFTSSEG